MSELFKLTKYTGQTWFFLGYAKQMYFRNIEYQFMQLEMS